jgi:putative nucleotidyltransferase with HDIG domain
VDDSQRAADLVKRFAAAIRAGGLYRQHHPLARRSLEALSAALASYFQRHQAASIGFIGDDIIVGRVKLKNAGTLASFARHIRERQVEKLLLSREMGRDGLYALVDILADADARRAGERLAATTIKGCSCGMIATDPLQATDLGLAAARQVYASAVDTAERLWGAVEADDEPDPEAARAIIDVLANAVAQDRTSILALTSLKSHDSYTFSHMVNVSLLTMAQARSLGVPDSLLREFGVAGLMHDIGKVKTPPELLNKPGKLTDDEMSVVKRHVVDGAQILRRTPDMPALAAVVAFEHHLRQDLSGYPERVGQRQLNLCTMLVSIADVFDALRTNRSYREGLPSGRVRAMLSEQAGSAFESTLLRRFITLVGLFPLGSFVRLQSGEIGVVSAEHATDPFRPQVRVAIDAEGLRLSAPRIINTWERDERGTHPFTVHEAVEPAALGLDPLALMAS